jgi:hypothetical protein
MADDPKSFMKKTDDELTFDALSAMPGSAVSLLNHPPKANALSNT